MKYRFACSPSLKVSDIEAISRKGFNYEVEENELTPEQVINRDVAKIIEQCNALHSDNWEQIDIEVPEKESHWPDIVITPDGKVAVHQQNFG